LDYRCPRQVDDTINYYIQGIEDESYEMMYYSWFSGLGYIYSLGTSRTRVQRIHDILVCAISNEVDYSYYGNRTFLDNTWKPAKNYFEYSLFATYDWYVLIFFVDFFTAGAWEVL